MRKLTYLAVVEPGDDCFGIFFPDLPGCTSMSDDLDHIVNNAKEALSLHIYGMEQDNDPLPEPSKQLSHEDTEGCFVMPITIFPDLFRRQRESRRVKTNITIQEWLKDYAKSNNVNLSKLIESSLLDMIESN